MMNGFKVALLAGTVMLAAAGSAQAVVVSYNSSVPTTTTNFSSSLGVTKFDTALGNLQSISFSLSGTVVATIKFESLDGSASTVTGTSSASITLTRPDATTLVTVLPTQSRTQSETAFDGAIDFGGTSGDTFTGLTGSTTALSSLLTSASDIALFSAAGGGTILLPISAAGTSNVSGAGNIVSQINTAASAQLMVTYNYDVVPPPTTDVPEPASLALLGAGLVGLGMIRRKSA